jgi:hypothetical protein
MKVMSDEQHIKASTQYSLLVTRYSILDDSLLRPIMRGDKMRD